MSCLSMPNRDPTYIEFTQQKKAHTWPKLLPLLPNFRNKPGASQNRSNSQSQISLVPALPRSTKEISFQKCLKRRSTDNHTSPDKSGVRQFLKPETLRPPTRRKKTGNK
ncbi:hypothetical protein TNIN_181601 [Trichonephila inaurata madagascariensis]|uniref:Uncharacterized protein n=1 Tax=Trichonephila inaurata madagascariensis TaxID=2747483 RepID=A0A8X6XYW8_9ARAC|nr:hypothetical protein TNIN_181601 [Trichonephila inaurata madagascariensis]